MHGSRDRGHAEVVDRLAAQVRTERPDLDATVGYLDHGAPLLADLRTAGAVVVPLLLSSGYHVRADIPAAAPDAGLAAAVGPDPLLAEVLGDRLTEAGWAGEAPVVLAAPGSADPSAIGDVETAAAQLAGILDVPVSAAYVSAGAPALTEVTAVAVASYVLAPGHFAAQIAACGAAIVSAPIGADPRVAELILARYDAAASSMQPQ